MKIEEYLEQGGVLSSPENAPPRYRAELLRLMATFVDSELAAAAGFADMINAGPGIPERVAAARIVMEKTESAGKVLRIMGEFGANTGRYVGAHPWADRLDRDADIGATRREGDMRLSVFNYPMTGWEDSVVMHLLMGLAADEQLGEFSRVSYGPLAEVFREIAPIEAAHTASARKGVERLIETGTDKATLQASVDYWWPRVSASFGHDVSSRATTLAAFGLRNQTNTELRECWLRRAGNALAELGLTAPEG